MRQSPGVLPALGRHCAPVLPSTHPLLADAQGRPHAFFTLRQKNALTHTPPSSRLPPFSPALRTRPPFPSSPSEPAPPAGMATSRPPTPAQRPPTRSNYSSRFYPFTQQISIIVEHHANPGGNSVPSPLPDPPPSLRRRPAPPCHCHRLVPNDAKTALFIFLRFCPPVEPHPTSVGQHPTSVGQHPTSGGPNRQPLPPI